VNTPTDGPRGRWALPAPAARPPIFPRPADIIRDLVTLLSSYGLTRMYWSASAVCGVLSLPHVTVWLYDGHCLTWQHDGSYTRWPATDTEGAARHLAALAGCKVPGSA
jgi:hypothetical protein